MAQLNYKHLHYFWVIAREQSVSRAAEHLHLTPQTLSGQLAKLEESLGIALFERRGRSLVLTDMGEIVFEYSDAMFSAGQELKEILEGRRLGHRGRLRVGIVDVVPKLLAHRFMREGIEAFPEYFLSCYEGKHENLVQLLASHKIDIVISDRGTDESFAARTYVHALGATEVAFFAPRAMLSRVTGEFPACLAEVPLLLPTPNTLVRRDLERWFETVGVAPLVVAEFEDIALLKVFAAEGMGCFPAAAIIATEIERQYGVERIGTTAVREQYFGISVERRIRNAAALAVLSTAKKVLAV
jgi:LysR family transcriptional regulator, transcriptional activator of nhaA